MEVNEKLLRYRPKNLWVRLASLFSRTRLLSQQKEPRKAVKVQKKPIRFYYYSYPGEYDRLKTIPPLGSFVGVLMIISNESWLQILIGLLLIVAGLAFVANEIWGKTNTKKKGSFVLSPESLSLPGKGEFLWVNISDIAFKERFGSLKVLLVQLSNGTVVEHRVKSYNTSSNKRATGYKT